MKKNAKANGLSHTEKYKLNGKYLLWTRNCHTKDDHRNLEIIEPLIYANYQLASIMN